MSFLTGPGVIIVSWALAWLSWRQFLRGRAAHKACWALGLSFLAAAVTLEVLARGHGVWTDGAYRAWYYLGAMQGVTFIGQGTLMLVSRAEWTRTSLEVVVLLAVVGLLVTLAAPVDFSRLASPAMASGLAFPEIAVAGLLTPRSWTIPFNVWGTVWMVGGAVWSTWRLRRLSPARALGTGIIALSGFVLAGTSVLNRFGVPGLEGLGRTAGVGFLFMGFTVSGWRAWPEWLARWAWPAFRRYYMVSLAAFALLWAFTWLEPGLVRDFLANPGLVIVALVVAFPLVVVVQAARGRNRRTSRQ